MKKTNQPEISGQKTDHSYYIIMLSVHGLIRGHKLELGRDADTGGQTKYVVELARALAELPEIGQVDLVTRLVNDPAVAGDYAEPIEIISEKARIVRIEAGPDEYLNKEELWDHLDIFADSLLEFVKAQKNPPNFIHSHYADAGYVGIRLANLLGIPLLHTGHSLGRVKRRRLLAAGLTPGEIEERFNMKRRIEAEEQTLAGAARVITSTNQEIEEQYELYDCYHPEIMRVIPPGVDLERFFPPDGQEKKAAIAAEIDRFLAEPEKPLILALSRADARKNIGGLIEAYGNSEKLKKKANLLIIAGEREDIGEMDSEAREVLNDLLLLIDRYDLYGKIAYPKHHHPEEVPVIYRLAAARQGVFINPALTEPFGLTLLEAAASGLPLVATEDGGPRDIIGNCENGKLVDPLDGPAMAAALLEVLNNNQLYHRWSTNGTVGVRRHYSWPAHARRYLEILQALEPDIPTRLPLLQRPASGKTVSDRAMFSDLDQNLLGDPSHLPEFTQLLRRHRKNFVFGIATGRRLDSAVRVLRQAGLPEPDVLITSTGTAINYAPELSPDKNWARHIDHRWTPHVVRRILDELPGLKIQPRKRQSRFKLSYYIDPRKSPSLDEINRLLYHEDLSVNTVLSFGQYLDILPLRASKGYAIRYFADRWEIPLENLLVAGGSGADEDMMRGNTMAVMVSNRHHEELSGLTDSEKIYFAQKPYARGIIEAIEHYNFFANN